MSGEAMRMRIEIANLMRKHQLAPKPSQPAEPLPPLDGDWIVEGIAAPGTIDREFTKFAPHCWMPFRKNIPLLFRHDRPVGEVLEVRTTDAGLRVRALVRDDEAKRCSYFSVAATIHGYQLRDVDDSERFHALVTCASLDEITLTNSPANAAARVEHRYRQSPSVECYDLARRGVICIAKLVELMAAPAAPSTAPPPPARQPLRRTAARAHFIMRKPPTEFAALVGKMNQNAARMGAIHD